MSSTILATPAVSTSAITVGHSGYSPAQVLHAYGFDKAASGIGAVGGTGAGQTIAIVEAYNDPTLLTDLQVFDRQFHLGDPTSLKQLNQAGGTSLPAANTQWATETALDVEWAHAVAPQANIVVVEAGSDQISNLLAAVNTARNLPEVSVVSMSWGTSEFPTETSYDNIFTTPANHQSVSFVASSGDTSNSNGVQWPAASPNVVSVGGSTLTVTPTGASETSFAGAVSGVSQFEPTPPYQASAVIGKPTPAARTTPDVVYNANPTPGFAVFDSGSGGWQTVGGTSSGAPQWASLLAIANQVRADAGKSSLNGTTQTLPAIYQYYNNNQQATVTAPVKPSTNANAVNVVATGVVITSGALVSNTGAPQAGSVITALVANNTPARPAVQTAPVPKLSKLPHKQVHPLILNFAPRPLLQFAAPFANAASDIPSIMAGQFMSPDSRPTPSTIGLTISHPGCFSALSLSAQSLPAATVAVVTSAGDAVAQAVAAIGGDMSLLGTGNVVSVGVQFASEAESHGHWFIAHLSVGSTFGDSMSAFINDSTTMRPIAFISHSPATHLRAWAVTIGVLALDAMAIYYLASHRQRRRTLVEVACDAD